MQQELVAAYAGTPVDANNPAQLVAFGTSGHRGSPLKGTFNCPHLLAIAQAVVDYRKQAGIDGPLFVGRDTHAASLPAWQTVVQVLVANGVDVRLSKDDVVTATPLVSRAILNYNANRSEGLADGLIITPSHNPPEDGGIKYNPPNGGPADTDVTDWMQQRANRYLQNGCRDVRQLPLKEALQQSGSHDFVQEYVADLDKVINLAAIRRAGLKLGADPMGGTALPVWQVLAQDSSLGLTVTNPHIDESFAFMPPDHDGRTRMDCSSPHAMANLLNIRQDYDLAFGNDPDADRHGIVDAAGLMNPNHFICVCIDYLLTHREHWPGTLKIGKTLVTSSMVDRIVAGYGRELYEVPVGFKWFVDGLHGGWLGFAGEESAGASLLTLDGKAWSTDKDGIVLCLLAAEITAVTGLLPSEYYAQLEKKHGQPLYRRVDAPASTEQKAAFKRLTAESVTRKELAGEPILQVLTAAPGNGAGIGGLKVMTENGWFAARPSGTEALYKIYAESFLGEAHLQRLLAEAQQLVDSSL
ncbi:MAG: alpha-D-glucose phosphate-specific phosphoglucomutase [Gammaproteobacteria bacterium]|nr:alpha-D-glucose phosphate-specific phosphoglucomutase [Gammaproteobacteria bacterium]